MEHAHVDGARPIGFDDIHRETSLIALLQQQAVTFLRRVLHNQAKRKVLAPTTTQAMRRIPDPYGDVRFVKQMQDNG